MQSMHALLLIFLNHKKEWSDAALAVGNFYSSYWYIPMLRSPAKPPLKSSVHQGLIQLAGAFFICNLHAWLLALSQVAISLQWFALAYQELRQRRAA